MVIKSFPLTSSAHRSGLLAIGGDLDVPSLLLAYKKGIFPWPFSDRECADLELPDNCNIPWFTPTSRAVLFLKDFHLPRRLRRIIKKKIFSFKIDHDAERIIHLCRETHLGDSKSRSQAGTWITADIVEAYLAFHKAGYCHTIGCYQEDNLVGGLYGVAIGKMFAGESMFHLVPNASKLCLCFLVSYLMERGIRWIDCQQLTPLLQTFGAVEIPREEFEELLNDAVETEFEIFRSVSGGKV